VSIPLKAPVAPLHGDPSKHALDLTTLSTRCIVGVFCEPDMNANWTFHDR